MSVHCCGIRLKFQLQGQQKEGEATLYDSAVVFSVQRTIDIDPGGTALADPEYYAPYQYEGKLVGAEGARAQ